jgi:carbamoyl-phosphate synthase large subunit
MAVLHCRSDSWATGQQAPVRDRDRIPNLMTRSTSDRQESPTLRPGVLVLGGGRWQLGVIRAASRAGFRTVVADIQADPPGRALADEFVQVDTSDCERLLALAKRTKVAATIAEQTDRTVPVAAYLNEALSLPGIRPDVALRFTNKYAMRNALRSVAVDMPKYAEVRSIREAAGHAAEWGFPVAVKPKRAQSSLGVFKVERESDLPAAFARSMAYSSDERILIEEFIEGTEITVEGLSADGRCTILAISEKEPYAHNACVARRLVYPPAFPDELMERIREVSATVVEALGLRNGISHAEYRIRDGRPYLIEVAARGGGSGIASMIVSHVSGVDMYDLLLRHLLRGEPIVIPSVRKRSAVLEFFDFAPGKVKAIRGLDELRDNGVVHEIDLGFAEGDTIRRAEDDRSRTGYFIARGETRHDVDNASRLVHETLTLEYE